MAIHSRGIARLLCLAATLGALPSAAAAQQPQLAFPQRACSRQQLGVALGFDLVGRPGDLCVLLADLAPGSTSLFGTSFDLAFTPALLPLHVTASTGNPQPGFLPLQPGTLPAGLPVFCQFGSWDVAQDFGSLLVSNVDSFVAFDGPAAFVLPFTNAAHECTGGFDRTVRHRLQALPPRVRTVTPLPPQAFPSPGWHALQPLHPSGARVQQVYAASDLGANGLPERLTAVRWRPLFGVVQPEVYPQFELRAAHTDVVPDYRIDPWSGLPMHPNSGLSTQFAANPRPGSAVTLCNGSHAILPQDLLPSGYLPFPAPQQTFVDDGSSSLLLDSLCMPTAGLGVPQNAQLLHLMVPSSPQPFGTLFAVAGFHGQPSPLQPGSVPQGFGSSSLYDWKLELEQTVSQATSAWLFGPSANPVYQAPIVAAHAPPGTAIQLEFRGSDAGGATVTNWSASPSVADGLLRLQVRIGLHANPSTGAVPWLDTLVVPIL